MTLPCPRYGFTIDVRQSPHRTAEQSHSLWQAFLGVVERYGLELVPRGPHDSAGWPCALRGEAAQATDADREMIREWAAGQPGIETVALGPLVDLSARD